MKPRRAREETIKLLETSMPWEEVRDDVMESKEGASFRHRKDALEGYMAGDSLEQIKAATGVGANYLRIIIARCLTIAPDGKPYGYRALIKNMCIKGYVRTKESPETVGPKGAGLAGIMNKTFNRYPGIQKELDAFILKIQVKDKGKDKATETDLNKFRNRPKDAHRQFIKLLRDRQHPETEWPFNVANMGSRAISGYVKSLQDANMEKSVRVTGDSAAIAHLPIGTGKESYVRITDFNQCWMIDSHTIDYICAIEIVNQEGVPSFKPLMRLHVLLLYEALARAPIWYRVVYGAEVTANDISALVREALSKELPKPKNVIPNLAPNPGAGFMTEIFPELAQSLPSWISLDNAWAHLAGAVRDVLRKEIGCGFDYGPPMRFERRARIESNFNSFTEELSKRLRSTVGGGPDKGNAKDAIEASVKYRISSDYLEHLAYVAFANTNIMTTEGLGFTSPKLAIEAFLRRKDDHFLPRILPANKLAVIGTALVRICVPVRGNRERAQRPFINFERVRYRFKAQNMYHLIGQKIYIEVNEADIRGFFAYSLDGEPLGWMSAESYWGQDPHSRKTRKAINSKKYLRIQEFVNGGNLIEAYNAELLRIVNTERKKSRKAASEIDRLKHEIARAAGDNKEPLNGVDESPPKSEAQASAISPKTTPSSGWLNPPDGVDLSSLLKKIR